MSDLLIMYVHCTPVAFSGFFIGGGGEIQINCKMARGSYVPIPPTHYNKL